MSNYSPADALEVLLNAKPLPLAMLGNGFGMYSLTDENGVVRYIGETGQPFLKRIHGYHCAGDDNSHKFSTVFNAGRLWQMSSVDVSPVKRAINNEADGRIAKALRAQFARSRCHARTIDLPGLNTLQRKALEAAILAIAPADNRKWNDKRVLHPYEPAGLDDFISSLGWSEEKVAAVERQSARWHSLSANDRIVVRKPRSS